MVGWLGMVCYYYCLWILLCFVLHLLLRQIFLVSTIIIGLYYIDLILALTIIINVVIVILMVLTITFHSLVIPFSIIPLTLFPLFVVAPIGHIGIATDILQLEILLTLHALPHAIIVVVTEHPLLGKLTVAHELTRVLD